MDGAIVLASDASRIARANVHLVPDPNLPTSETGTRHRTAERVSRQLNVPVVTVSEELHIIAVLAGEEKVRLEEAGRVLARAEQALTILERSISNAEAATQRLAALEIEDLVAGRDVIAALARSEMVRREIAELEGHAVELGTEARLVKYQLEEITASRRDDARYIVADYTDSTAVDDVVMHLSTLPVEDLADPQVMAEVLGIPEMIDPDVPMQPRGWRALSRISRISIDEIAQVIDHFGTLAVVFRASQDDVAAALNGDTETALAIKDGLARLAESSILEQYS